MKPNRIPRLSVLAAALIAAGAGPRARADETARASKLLDDDPLELDAGPDRTETGERVPPPDTTSTAMHPPETPVSEVCQAAVRFAQAEPERARSFVRRARLAGWLPEVRFRVYRRFARTEGLSFNDATSGTIAPVDISAIDDVRYEWRATWDLSRMVFNPDELQAHSEALRMADVRRDIQSLVIRLYFERRRLLREMSTSRPTSTRANEHENDKRALRVGEIEAELDALSDGAFTGGGPASRAPGAPLP